MPQMTIYARKEKTTDRAAITHGLSNKRDTVYYRDAQCTEFYARKPWYQSGHPTRRTKTVMLDCAEFLLEWV